MQLDTKDHKIIAVLRENSRTPIRDIAKQTSLRPSTVHQRIQKLINNNIIENFTLKLNNKAIGENFIVFMLITATKEINQEFLKKPEIKEVFGVTGEYDLILKLKFKDVETFNKFVINFRKQTGIRKTLTMVATANIKEQL